MKKILTRHKTNIPKIPNSKTSTNKLSLDLSIPGNKKILMKNKNDSINKETVDGSCVDGQTLPLNQDSLNNTKLTINKNYSFGKLDNKLLLFTSSLKYSLNKRNKSTNLSKKVQVKTYDECSENISSSEDDIISNGKNEYNEEDEDTNKIDYRYFPKIPEIEGNKDNNNPYYWLATYDKLMKKSKIAKILNYYSDSLSHKDSEIFVIEDENSDYNEEETKVRIKKMNEKYNFKEKTMIIQGYELYFVKKHGKPFIQQKEGGKLFIKLYLLNLEQINQIFSYINRLEYKQYIDNLQSFIERNTFKKIQTFNKSIYNYSTIFCLGTFMNINIYAFSHSPNKNMEENYNYTINDLPSSNKIAKIIKSLMINFPDFSKQYFIDYLMKPKDKNNELGNHDMEILRQKMGEVNSLIISNNKKNYKVNIKSPNNVIKNIVKGIPTNTPNSFKTPNEINSNNKSHITSGLTFLDKNMLNICNSNNNNIMNCSDFLSNIKSELDGFVSEVSNKNTNNNEEEYKKALNEIKLNNTSYTRNKNNNILNNSNKTNKSSSNQTIYSFKGISNNNQKICKTISLKNQAKKSLTRNNSNNFIHYKKTKNIKRNNNSYNSIKQQSIDNSIKKKENNNILNKVLINEYYTNDKKIKKNNNSNSNNIYVKTDSGHSFKITRNKNNAYLPYYTNNNTNNINSKNKEILTQNVKNSKFKKPIRVLSSIRKVISQKMNNLSQNSSFIQFNKNDSNSSFKEICNNRYLNENSNLEMNKSKYNNRIICKTNNNSLNKNNEYITPLKKKFFHYYH